MSARLMKRTGVILLLFTILLAVSAFAELKPEYRRNGECYLLIGEGPTVNRGIFRLNNPESNKYFNPPKYLFMPDSSIGFSVDLTRNIYTFSEKLIPGYTLLSQPLKRQVVDSGSTDLADYGYHQYIHYDHRSWGKNTAVYRTGPKGRNIRAYSGSWGAFKSAGPGKLISAQSSDVLPTGISIPLGAYSGKNWYEIPNGAWFSSWRTKPCRSSRPGPAGYFYVVYGDKVEGQPHNWTLYSYAPDDVNADAPNYTKGTGAVVAVSYDKKFTRQIFAGCLDGCGGASGSGSGVADPMITDVAFMPPIKSQPSRTYFYSRPVNKSDYTVTLNKAAYAPPNPSGNPIIGSPSNPGTYWIGVSMKNISSDYVYCTGTDDIKTWYNQATNSSAGGIKIDAVTVSNQWNQKGGIVFAYDKSGKMVYKFIRYENDGAPVSQERYEGIDVKDVFSQIDADKHGEIDDIKADGFGSLYFALTYPSKNVNTYDPRVHFEVNDTFEVYPDPLQNTMDSEYTAWLFYKQEYGKAVFERSIYNSVPKEIGKKVFATKYYNLNIRINPAGLTELINSGPFPNSRVSSILSSWTAQIGNNDGTITKNDFNTGSLGRYPDVNDGDPGRAKLAVINVPTPPEVLSLGGKKSYLDICGPYSDIPVSTDINSTSQSQNLIVPAPAELALDTLYYYMVENYPLTTGAWDPTDQPDWDGDGRKGGFITSINNPNSSTSGGSVAYRWRTWLVEDLYGNPVCPPEPYPITAPPKDGTDTGQENFTFFYSPVRGKYIITSQVMYDWYDYDQLAFGSTVDDLPSVYRPNEKALPVSPSGISFQTASDQLTSIMTNAKFKFMQASASIYIQSITENSDQYFACMPVIAGGIGTNPPPPDELIARIDRCDGWGDNATSTPNHWKPAQTTHKPAGALSGYHGLKTGNTYYWRIALASQTTLFDDVSIMNSAAPQFISRKLITDKMTIPEYNSSGDQINTLYVNFRDKVQFFPDGDYIRWMDDVVRLEAYLEYTVPDDNGDPRVVKLPLLSSSTTALAANFPIIASTSGNLPPTDPYFADLVIKMGRTISYDMWVLNKDKTQRLFPVRKLPLPFTLTGRTKVMIVDRESPKILYDHTKPLNLFADAGFPLTAGVGPQPNPASISFRLSDNNPWEAVDKVVGITSLSEWTQNNTNNNSPKTTAPTATFNYRPVFAKTLNRKASISFDRAARIGSGTLKVYPPNFDAPTTDDHANDKNFALSFGEQYTHKFVLNGLGKPTPAEVRLQRDFHTTKDVVNGTEMHFATIGFRMPINFIRLNSKTPLLNKLPKGYANNTPGYYADGKIRPYFFYVSASDSSGNSLNDQQLNLALHPRDVHKPNPYGYFSEFKNNATSYFPIKGNVSGIDINDEAALSAARNKTPQNVDDCTFNEDFFDNSDLWKPDQSAKGYINNQVGYYQSLAQLKTDIVKNFSSDAAYNFYTKQIDAKVAPNYIEDNVEFRVGVGVSDNAGIGVATLTFKYFDQKGDSRTREVSSKWENVFAVATSTASTDPLVASFSGNANGLFRGENADFPLSIPVTITCEDNALEWDIYNGGGLSDPGNPWSSWKWGSFTRGAEKKNKRKFETSIPVYGTNLIIRTIDKGMRNQN